MSTRTRTQQRSTPSTRRFAKPGAPPRGRRTTSTSHARPLHVRRRKPQKTGTAKAFESLTGLVGGKKAASSGSKGAKAGAGMAMLTAAGLAFKNRDKLTSMLKRDSGAPHSDASVPPPGTTGEQVHSETRANATAPRTGESPGGLS
jgi:hypothetical protein